WDHHTDADSRGGVLFAEWWAHYRTSAKQIFTVSYDFKAEPFSTPDGLADQDAALAALSEAAVFVEDNFGALDVPWGDVYRVKLAGQNIPANGADGELGVFRVIWAGPWELGTPLDADQQYPGTGGDGFVAVVEFGTTIHAQVLTIYGNASQPGSPHAGDQLALFAQQKLRDALLTREAVEANLEKEETVIYTH
ncbi:MAG TPA: penicillin acylase family protein, partial [Phototrophicaceae bacterium]|nr:penicillin acylase family protein [Phototrophicaceae bacterium]